MLSVGWRLRTSRTTYALILQGGSVGVLYLTIFAAMRLYDLVPAGVAMGLLVLLSVLSASLAILQDARSLAVIGILGGFLAPVLTSTGSGNHVMLFSYYAFLNGGILFTAWHKSWRELNLLGFIFTFGIGSVWGAQNYFQEIFATTEPFLVLFFIFYVLIGILFAKNQPLNLKGYIGGPSMLQPSQSLPWRKYLVWGMLSCGVLLIGWMSATLYKQMQTSSPE